MKIKLKHIQTILSSEGDIASILQSESEELFIIASTNLGMAQIICPTNRSNIQLYLKSRITLKQLFLLSQSEHYIILTDSKVEAKFFEIDPDNIPKEITGMQYGNELFHLLPKSIRIEKTMDEILKLLPPIDDGVKLLLYKDITITKGQVQFFKDNSPIQVVQVESNAQNYSEFDYLSVPLKNENGKLMCRLSPMVLLLFLSNFTIKDVFMSMMDKEFYFANEKGIHKVFYTDGLQGFIDRLSCGNLTYFSLPSEMIIDNPIEVWDYYTRNIVMSGHGVLPADFEREYPVEISIERSNK